MEEDADTTFYAQPVLAVGERQVHESTRWCWR